MKLDNPSGFIELFWLGVLIVEHKSAERETATFLLAGLPPHVKVLVQVLSTGYFRLQFSRVLTYGGLP